jgi:AcrR family transcriptional regulator
MGEGKLVSKIGRPVRMPGEKSTKERIFEAAVDLFASRGYDGTSMRQIAGAVGLTESALYRHYPSKEAILDAILDYTESGIYTALPIEETLGVDGGDSIFRGLLAPLPGIIAGMPLVVRIMRILYAEMNHNERIREFFRREFVERADDHMEALFRSCVEAGSIKPCDTRSLARVFNAFRAEWTFRTFGIAGAGTADAADEEALRSDLEGPIRLFEELFVQGK